MFMLHTISFILPGGTYLKIQANWKQWFIVNKLFFFIVLKYVECEIFLCILYSHLCKFILDRRQIEFKCLPLTSVYVVLIPFCQLETEGDLSLRYQKLRELPKHCPGHLVSKVWYSLFVWRSTLSPFREYQRGKQLSANTLQKCNR